MAQKIVHLVKDNADQIESTVRNTHKFIANPRVLALTGSYGTDNVTELFKQGLFDKTPLPIVGVSIGARLLREPLNPTIFQLRASYVEEVDGGVIHSTFSQPITLARISSTRLSLAAPGALMR